MAEELFRKKEKKPEENLSWQENLLLYLHDLVLYTTVIVLLFLLVFRVVVVSGSSMYPTLLDGDYLLLLGSTFYREPEAGDIVVLSKDTYDDGAPLVKRVIATEGQIVDIDFDNGIVYVDGLPLEEPYINTPTNRAEGMEFPLIVEEDCCFVMGDNRNNSLDSRNPRVGQVDKREILGKAIFLLLPASDKGASRDFGRIGAIK